MGFYTIQTGFSRGEIAPEYYDRQDFDGWNYALKRARNVLITPAAVQVRPGTQYIATVNSNAALNYKMCKLDFSVTQVFYAVIYANTIKFYNYFTDSLEQTLTVSISDAQVTSIKTTFFNLALIITNGAFTPQVVTFDAAESVGSQFSIADYPYTNYPNYDFDPGAYDDSVFSLINGRTTGQNGTLTVSSGSFTFSSDFVGGQLTAIGSDQVSFAGTANITALDSSTQVTLYITSTIGDDQTTLPLTLNGTDIVLTQKAFTDDTGYPALAGGFQNRVLLASSSKVPTGWWASETGDGTSYDVGQGLATDAIVYSINESDTTKIYHVVNNQTIQFATNNGLYVFNQEYVGGLTPSNVNLLAVNKYRYDSSFQPIVYDGMTIGLIKGGQTLIGTQYTGAENYNNTNLSVLSAHLVNNPTVGCVWDGALINLPTMAFFVNSDGTLLQYQSMQTENINGFTLSTTGESNGDKFLSCLSVETDVYFLVIRGSSVMLEKMDFSLRVDSGKTQTSGSAFTVVTGLEHLNGREVVILCTGFTENNGQITINDNYVMQPRRTVSGGQVTLDYAVKTAIVGLEYNPEIVPLAPLIPQGQMGSSFYNRKKRYQVLVSYYNSLGVTVIDSNNSEYLIPTLDFGTGAFLPPVPSTNVYKFDLDSGWSRAGTDFTITQNIPFPWTIKGLTQYVETED